MSDNMVVIAGAALVVILALCTLLWRVVGFSRIIMQRSLLHQEIGMRHRDQLIERLIELRDVSGRNKLDVAELHAQERVAAVRHDAKVSEAALCGSGVMNSDNVLKEPKPMVHVDPADAVLGAVHQ